MQWVRGPRTSSYTAANEACVEVGRTTEGVAFLDSKFKFREGETSPVLLFGPEAGTDFLNAIKTGKYEL